MSSFEISLLMGIWPIIYFLVYATMNRQFLVGQRIRTTVLELRGRIIQVGPTHSLILFDDGSQDWYRNSYFTEE